jgi:hypothetical protein
MKIFKKINYAVYIGTRDNEDEKNQRQKVSGCRRCEVEIKLLCNKRITIVEFLIAVS